MFQEYMLEFMEYPIEISGLFEKVLEYSRNRIVPESSRLFSNILKLFGNSIKIELET